MEHKCTHENCNKQFPTVSQLLEHVKNDHEIKSAPIIANSNKATISEKEILVECCCDELSEVEQLILRNRGISNIESDIECEISKLSNLRYLCVSHNNIKQLTGIKQFTILEELNISFNQIVDISPLSVLRQLVRLYASNNQIKDIGTLLILTELKYTLISQDIECIQQSNQRPLLSACDSKQTHQFKESGY